ncbi:MAG: hypothetical protein RLZZ29_1076 [Cyanobacteriota bacterium]|jgi:hypothetical protein|uniref:NYN domain-containing protein n=1 Tax=Cylindrospermopsis raciborskii TaxID=77022 RepID=UPI001A2E5AC7|nr:NYN domain-containing protein [Cylindrospermopsis raciborskii]MBG0742371.1 NYN domain-containing protein [Cylindrospermopsis raciborskii KL1]
MPPSTIPSILLVDGYNIIGSWPCLKKTRDDSSLEAARDHLVELITNYSAFEGYETHIVFDAHYQNTPSNREMITDFLTVHYTEFGQTADTYIEKVCAGLRHQVAQCLVSRVIVATSDRAQQLVVQGYGAEWLSARQLCNQVEAKVCQMRNQHQSRKKSKGRFLSDSINDEARQKLIRLRMGL